MMLVFVHVLSINLHVDKHFDICIYHLQPSWTCGMVMEREREDIYIYIYTHVYTFQTYKLVSDGSKPVENSGTIMV